MARLFFSGSIDNAYISVPEYLDITKPDTFRHVLAEGALLTSGNVAYDQAQAMRLARLPLEGKLKPKGRKPKIILLHGHPGAGKTSWGKKRLDSLDPKGNQYVVSSYDEHGALFAMPEYQRDMKAAGNDFAKRSEVWARYRAISQRIRSATLSMAIAAKADLYIDTTSSSDHTFKLVQELQIQGYEVEVWSYLAPLDVAMKRVLEKARGGDIVESFTKRLGAFGTFPKFICGFDDGKTVTKGCDTVRLFMNCDNEREPIEAATWQMKEANPVLTSSNKGALQILRRTLATPTVESISNAYGEYLSGYEAELGKFAKAVEERWSEWLKLRTSGIDLANFVLDARIPPDKTLRRNGLTAA